MMATEGLGEQLSEEKTEKSRGDGKRLKGTKMEKARP